MWDMNFNPEVFYKKESTWGFVKITPFEHKSNGAPSGPSDRDWDRFGLTLGSSFDFWRLQLFYSLKGYYIYYTNDKNSDIRDYLGCTEARLGLKFNEDKGIFFDREELSVRLISGFNGLGAREYSLKFRPLIPDFSPFIYFQIWEGYGEALLNYNVYNKAYRVGLIFQ
jgi:outer membrane phospholipase A